MASPLGAVMENAEDLVSPEPSGTYQHTRRSYTADRTWYISVGVRGNVCLCGAAGAVGRAATTCTPCLPPNVTKRNITFDGASGVSNDFELVPAHDEEPEHYTCKHCPLGRGVKYYHRNASKMAGHLVFNCAGYK
jgi:hypothetical protein